MPVFSEEEIRSYREGALVFAALVMAPPLLFQVYMLIETAIGWRSGWDTFLIHSVLLAVGAGGLVAAFRFGRMLALRLYWIAWLAMILDLMREAVEIGEHTDFVLGMFGIAAIYFLTGLVLAFLARPWNRRVTSNANFPRVPE